MLKERRVVVIGSANIDLVVRVPRLPRSGETVAGGTFFRNLGGKGANQAVAAARAGAVVSFVGCVGSDSVGTEILAGLEAEGIDLQFCQRSDRSSSGVALIMVDHSGANTIAVAPGSNSLLMPEHLDRCRSLIQTADVVLTQMEVPAETVLHALGLAKQMGARTILNYAPIPEQRIPMELVGDMIVLNELELCELTGRPCETIDEVGRAARMVLEQGPTWVIATLGPQGVWVESEAVRGHVPAYKVEALDSTAAGDTFCGAFASRWHQSWPIFESVEFAAAAAAIAVSRAGAQASIPRQAEIEALIMSR